VSGPVPFVTSGAGSKVPARRRWEAGRRPLGALRSLDGAERAQQDPRSRGLPRHHPAERRRLVDQPPLARAGHARVAGWTINLWGDEDPHVVSAGPVPGTGTLGVRGQRGAAAAGGL